MTHISLQNVHVRYPIFHEGRAQSILTQVARTASFGVLGRRDGRDLSFVHALRGVSLSLREGDRVGLIGRNGAGKSTLLKTLAGINWPHGGARVVDGRISTVLSLGAGLDMDKSGFANIEFLGRLFGMDAQRRAALTNDLIEFTQLGEYLTLPVRTYSSGMLVRLAFGLLTSLPGDILMIDEVIGAGDAFFIERASQRAREMARTAKILVLASHSEEVLQEFCTHVIWLDHGLIVDYGDVHGVNARYKEQAPRFPGGVAIDSDILRGADPKVFGAARAAAG